jgi:predicted outer membrane repeat protein
MADTVVVDIQGIWSPYTTIQEGIDLVQDGGTVLVVDNPEGFPYKGAGNRGLSFGGKNIELVSMFGSATIDCEGADRAILLGAGTDSTTHISGFVFQNGNGGVAGGAILCEGGSPRISDCVFRGNTALFGGAIKLTEGATRFTGCDFYSNSAGTDGGALYATSVDVGIQNCLFSGNVSGDGGAMTIIASDLRLSRCTVARNSGPDGAGVLLTSSTAVIEQCILSFNERGKSVFGGSPEIFHCVVFGNAGGDSLPGYAHDNEFADPLVCDLYGPSGGNLSLCDNSPCLPGNNAWGLQIGCRAQGCSECDSPVEPASWGSIKALYR